MDLSARARARFSPKFSKMAAGLGQKIFFAFFSYLTKNTYMPKMKILGKKMKKKHLWTVPSP